MAPQRFPFRWERRYRVAAWPWAVTPDTAWVGVDHEQLTVRFGPWRLRTHLANIADACRTGPYRTLTTIGPARVSLTDGGVTFATNRDAGLCLLFHRPVPGIDAFGLIRHPGATVTVGDPDALAAALR